MTICNSCGIELEDEKVLYVDEDGEILCLGCYIEKHYDEFRDYCEEYFLDDFMDIVSEESYEYGTYEDELDSADDEDEYYDRLRDIAIERFRDGDFDLSDYCKDFADDTCVRKINAE